MTEPRSAQSSATPFCTAEAVYWRAGLRWQIALQVMYYAEQGYGQGPFFIIGHAWRKAGAQAQADEANWRLERSQKSVRERS